MLFECIYAKFIYLIKRINDTYQTPPNLDSWSSRARISTQIHQSFRLIPCFDVCVCISSQVQYHAYVCGFPNPSMVLHTFPLMTFTPPPKLGLFIQSLGALNHSFLSCSSLVELNQKWCCLDLWRLSFILNASAS